ncbi:MAG: hypothetical protein JSU87_13455 [Gemmatimonadota bacterium]|nr:MAG: hypothetical protein JSU87_13455 [Gemmatimonadota bacterium]
MQDLGTLKKQLAQEEAALAATLQQIERIQSRVDSLRAEIETTQSRIEAAEQQIEEFKRDTQAAEKRISLLREYMAMVERAPPPPPDIIAPGRPALDSQRPDAAKKTPAAPLPRGAPEDDTIGDLTFVKPLGPATPERVKPRQTEASTFDGLEDEILTYELLPRTQTFVEELLLVLAHHKKAVALKDIGRIFRRLDYAPKVAATEKIIRQHLESAGHLFEYMSEGRVTLSREGREEAGRLLEELL